MMGVRRGYSSAVEQLAGQRTCPFYSSFGQRELPARHAVLRFESAVASIRFKDDFKPTIKGD